MARFAKFAVVLLLLTPLSSFAWWNCAWEHRIPVNINRPSGASLNDYQVRLDLSSANVPASFDWNQLGDDLRLIDEDDLTELDYFIEQWDSGGQTAVLWVKLASLPSAGRTVYVYFGAPAGTPSATTVLTFTEPGLKFHTRRSSANPGSRSAAESAFNSASDGVNGYGCSFVNAYTNINNTGENGPPNRNSNIGLFAETFFEVGPGEAGNWEFRYGADFGYGGGLYVDDVAVDEIWNDDLWWDFNWNNSGEILQGSINLSAGTHSLRIIGFEGCCDGGLTAQFRRPGGPWLDVNVSNIQLVSRQCPIIEPTVSYASGEDSSCPDLAVTRAVQTFSDPFNNTNSPKAIPGAVMLNTVTISNSGPGIVDASSVMITEAIPANVALRVADFDGSTSGPVQFVDGSPASGMTYAFSSLGATGDNVAFSNNNGATYIYTPTADASGADPAITNFRITPGNAFQGDTGSGPTTAEFLFKTIVQ